MWPLPSWQIPRAAEGQDCWVRPVGEISPRPLLVVVVAQGAMALASGDFLAAMVPDCSLGSPESNPPDWQVGRVGTIR